MGDRREGIRQRGFDGIGWVGIGSDGGQSRVGLGLDRMGDRAGVRGRGVC